MVNDSMYLNRFSDILPDIIDNAILSLPVFNGRDEIIFSYFIDKVSGDTFKVSAIANIYVRDIKTNAINEIVPEKVISASRIDLDIPFSHNVTDDNPAAAYDEYIEVYESAFRHSFENNQENKKAEEILDTIIPESSLKEFYHYLKTQLNLD